MMSWAALLQDWIARFFRAFLPNILLGMLRLGGADAGEIAGTLDLTTSSSSGALLLSSESA